MLSDEMRQRIIVWHHEQHISASDIQTLAGCSLATIYNVLKFYRDYCTILIDSAWGVTCDQMDEILTTSNAGVTWDTV